MTNSQVAAVILLVYCVPGLVITWATWNSKKYGPVIDQYTLFEQVLFVAANTILWPVVVVKAVSYVRKDSGRKK